MNNLQKIYNAKCVFINFLKNTFSVALFLGLIVTETSATTIDVSFETGTVMFPTGTNITDQYSGYGILFSNDPTGLEGNFISSGWQENRIQDNSFFNLFRIDFIGPDPVVDVTVSFGDNNLGGQTHSLYAFDSYGSIVDVDSFFDGGLYNGIFDLTVSSTNGISSIIAYEQKFGAQQLEHITYTTSPVPVPAAAWLFGSGLLCLIGVARRKKAV